MSWCYRARRREDKGETWYEVVEYYGKDGYISEHVHPTGETLEGLIEDLERMLKDVKTRPVLEE